MTDPKLQADCSRCFALCCVVHPFSSSEDFAIDKPAWSACPYLTPSCRCSIHDSLAPRGFSGCASYTCHGAGQKVSQWTFAGRSSREPPALAEDMFEAFTAMRALHEQLALLARASRLDVPDALRAALQRMFDDVERLTLERDVGLLIGAVGQVRRDVRALLQMAAEQHLAQRPPRPLVTLRRRRKAG